MARRDRISALPDELIHYILSFLEMKDALKTSILSQRWRKQWKFNPNLDFPLRHNPSPFQGIYEVCAITECLQRYKSMQIQRLQLDLNLRMSPLEAIASWITFAADRVVQHLDIKIKFIDFSCFRVPISLFCCKSLRVLVLKYCILSPPSDFKGFPHLKSLYLYRVNFDDSNSLQSLISKCPCLQILELLDCTSIKHLKICNAMSLRHLTVSLFDKVEISGAPNLRYFGCEGEVSKLVLNNAPCLSSVDISPLIFVPEGRFVPQIISGWRPSIIDLSQVHLLTANLQFLQIIIAECYLSRKERIVFKNLKGLILYGEIANGFTLYTIIHFLQDCPLLETLELDVNGQWQLRNWIGSVMDEQSVRRGLLCCEQDKLLLNNLKYIGINGFCAMPEEIMLVAFLLDRAVVLEKFVAMGCTNELQDWLTTLPIRSATAEVIVEDGSFDYSL